MQTSSQSVIACAHAFDFVALATRRRGRVAASASS
jgi:hypothetical protein